MIKLIKLDKVSDNLIKELSLDKIIQIYECHLDSTKIGYAIIRDKKTERLYLIIDEEYQNKGYGSLAFKLLLTQINDDAMCSVPFENNKMRRIIQKNNGIEISRNGKTIIYIIEKKKN